jgi:hypothetical protein
VAPVTRLTDDVAECHRGAVGSEGARAGLQPSVEGACDIGCRVVLDRPQGADDMRVADELEGRGEVDRFVGQPGGCAA